MCASLHPTVGFHPQWGASTGGLGSHQPPSPWQQADPHLPLTSKPTPLFPPSHEDFPPPPPPIQQPPSYDHQPGREVCEEQGGLHGLDEGLMEEHKHGRNEQDMHQQRDKERTGY